MSYVATRIYPKAKLADVFAFKTERDARRWVKDMLVWCATAIKRRQIRIEYVGQYRLPVGVYFGFTPTTTWKCKEVTTHDSEKGS